MTEFQNKIIITNRNKIILGILILIATIIQFFFYQDSPYFLPDSSGYIALANAIKLDKLDSYNGERTPFYPLLLLLIQDYNLVIWLQILLNIIIVFLIFSLIHKITGNHNLAVCLSLFYYVYPLTANMAMSILTEITATFLLTLAVFIFISNYERINKLYYIFLISLIFNLAALTRPLYAIFPFFLLIFTIIHFQKLIPLKKYFQLITIQIILIILFLGGWSYINYSNNNTFSLTTLAGMNLTNTTGNFIESYEGGNKNLLNIYLKYRAQQLKNTGSFVNTIWRAYPEMMQTENLSYSEVSNYFFKASLYSIIKKPHLYIKNVFNSFINFWNPLLIKFNYTIKDFISQGLRILNFLIIIFFAFCIFLIKKIKFPAYLLFILFGILITSILQSLVEAGNHRFFLPTFPMLLILTSFLINNLLKQNLLQRVTYIIVSTNDNKTNTTPRLK